MERGFKHGPHEEEEDGETQYFVGDKQVDHLGGCHILDLVLLIGLAQGTRNEPITRIGKSRLTVGLHQRFDLGNLLVTNLKDLLAIGKSLYIAAHFRIAFQQFDG